MNAKTLTYNLPHPKEEGAIIPFFFALFVTALYGLAEYEKLLPHLVYWLWGGAFVAAAVTSLLYGGIGRSVGLLPALLFLLLVGLSTWLTERQAQKEGEEQP